jgi:DNA-binding beta-propeller fold protein YncE
MKKFVYLFSLLLISTVLSNTGVLLSQPTKNNAAFFVETSKDNVKVETSKYKVVGTIDIGGEAKWDYLSIEYTMHRLYVSHGSSVCVIDLNTNTVIGEIKDLHGVHGIAFAPEFGKGFISEGGRNSVTIFDIKTLQVLQIDTLPDKKPDAIVYDPFTKRIFAFNGGSENATAIDAATNNIVGSVPLTGSPEFAVSDGKGKMYVNIENKNELILFDPKTLQAIVNCPLTPCATPTGMAIDLVNRRIFVGGRNKLMAVVDAGGGKVIQTLPIGAGVDACAYDPKNHLVFCSCKDATITVIRQNTPDKYSVFDTIVTQDGAKTMAFDLTTNKIYASTMLSNPKDPKAKKSFGVLIIDNK